jgi:SEC-C motif
VVFEAAGPRVESLDSAEVGYIHDLRVSDAVCSTLLRPWSGAVRASHYSSLLLPVWRSNRFGGGWQQHSLRAQQCFRDCPARDLDGVEELFDRQCRVGNFQDRKQVGRNDPCPGGSGKKFKRCHGSSTAIPFTTGDTLTRSLAC